MAVMPRMVPQNGMRNKDITHAKIAETDREPPHSDRREKKYEFDNLCINA
jgi:hypothetical protein